jgi:hypothetical protein
VNQSRSAHDDIYQRLLFSNDGIKAIACRFMRQAFTRFLQTANAQIVHVRSAARFGRQNDSWPKARQREDADRIEMRGA